MSTPTMDRATAATRRAPAAAVRFPQVVAPLAVIGRTTQGRGDPPVTRWTIASATCNVADVGIVVASSLLARSGRCTVAQFPSATPGGGPPAELEPTARSWRCCSITCGRHPGGVAVGPVGSVVAAPDRDHR